MSSTQFVQLRHARTAFRVCGEGPPLLLIHGAEATGSSFDALARTLSKSMTVIAYDQRECGETQAVEPATQLPELVDDAAELIDALGLGKPTVLGTSFGGRLAQGLAILYPQKVDRLVLCNTWPLDAALEAINPPGVARLVELRSGLPDTARRLAQAYYGPDYVAAHPELVDRFARGSGMGSSRAGLIRQVHRLLPERIDAPTLLLSGSRDEVVPPHIMQGLHQKIRSSQLVEIEEAHHAITVEWPGKVAREIEAFVKGTPR